MDNDPSQVSKLAMNALREIECELCKIPSRSPDLNPCELNFHLVKDSLDNEAIERNIITLSQSVQRNYTKWVSVHYRDMCVLQSTHPSVCKYFINGSFVVPKTTKLFSSIGLDHCHEQVNAVVKGEGGAVRLTENPAALRRWIVAGPELSRMVQEFEGGNSSTEENVIHHEQKPAVQNAFSKDVLNTVASYKELGNPFLEEGESLVVIHTKRISWMMLWSEICAMQERLERNNPICLLGQLHIRLRRIISLH